MAKAVVQVRPKVFDRRNRAVGARVEDERAADVHVRGVVLLLEFEEGRIEWCQTVGYLTRERSAPGAPPRAPAPSYTAYVAPEKYAQIAWSSGSAAGASRSVARLFDRVDKRLDTVEIPRSLAEAGVPRDEFEAALPDLARTAFMDLSIRTNPRTSLVGKLVELLRSSYEGRPEENTSKGGI